jgi:hypothetical protein
MNAHSPPIAAKQSANWLPDLPRKLEFAYHEFDFGKSKAFSDLNELAESVVIDGHSLDAESAVIENEIWVAPGTIFVTLLYDRGSEEPVELDDAYPISIRFKVNENAVKIIDVLADVSSFYK